MGSSTVVPHKPKTNNTGTNNSSSTDNNNPIKSQNQASCAAIYLYTFTSFSFLLIIQSFAASSTSDHIHNNHKHHASAVESNALNDQVHVRHHRSREQKLIIHQSKTAISPMILSFQPLKDSAVPPYTHRNKTWFMSTLVSRPTHGLPEHFVFPSQPPNDRILCVDAQKKRYTLITYSDTFPADAIVAPGLTYLADSFYDYENPWHGLNAISPFFSWRRERGQCEKPRRFVLFKRGDAVVTKVGKWVHKLMKANLDREVSINDGILTESVNGESGNKSMLVCFERAVVMRRGLGGMEGKNRRRLFDMMRCKAWKFCGRLDRDGDGLANNPAAETESTGTSTSSVVNVSTAAAAVTIRVSLLVREGTRGFANATQVRYVIERECRKLPCKCEVRVLRLAAGENGNRRTMSFCEQVRVMRNSDVVVSTHGAQLTNMMFMPPGSSVMEMFPTGWLQGAGPGQFIYQWLADWSHLHYEGAWRDPHGIMCPRPSSSTTTNNKSEEIDMIKRCFAVRQKNQKVGVDEAYLARWTSRVLTKTFARKTEMNFNTTFSITKSESCPCD